VRWEKAHIGWIGAVLLLSLSCRKTGELLPNTPPDSYFVVDSIPLSGQQRLNSQVSLSWYGTDRDGYVTGFELSEDGVTWRFTERQDSLFKFALPSGNDSVDIELWLRSVDDKGAVDPDPAFLRIPVKNSPPQASFEQKALPNDSVRSVVTFRWNYSDPDGAESVVSAFLKVNQGNWTPIDRNQALLSLVLDPSASGNATAELYYGTENNASLTVDGLLADAPNQMYLKVQDLAGSESSVDSSNVFFLRQKTSDLLLVGAQPTSVRQAYTGLLDELNISYDIEDYHRNAAADAPKFWDPGFRLLSGLYDKLFIYADPSTLPPNPVSGAEEPLLNLAASAIQIFTDKGGKSLTTTSFTPTADITPLIGAFPIDQVISSPGQARIVPDSGLYSVDSIAYPDLFPSSIDIGVDPFVRSADSELFYRARLTRLSGWNGDDLIASRRRRNGSVNQILFSIELHKYLGDRSAMLQLFDQIFNDDFDW
jgi:hypothetical protein